jgi:hypothetical protein
MTLLKISDDFSLEDIRAIREDFSKRYEDNWDIDAMLKEIREGAARFKNALELQRLRNSQNPV